jgi:hypothetical protein
VRLFALIALLVAGAAAAQLRTIPADAERGEMRHVQGATIELNGARETLAPGARIRDQENRVIVPAALPSGAVVKFRRDANGAVQEVWILTPEEASR